MEPTIEQREFGEKRQIIEKVLEADDILQQRYSQGWLNLQKNDHDLPNERELDVKEVIKKRGAIPINQWMWHVLYGKNGYYSSGRSEINSGDFDTIVSIPADVYALNELMKKYVGTQTDPLEIISVASATGEFERNMHLVHTAYDEHPKDFNIASVEYSDKLLEKQQKRNLTISSTKSKSRRIDHHIELMEDDTYMFQIEQDEPFSIPRAVFVSFFHDHKDILWSVEFLEYEKGKPVFEKNIDEFKQYFDKEGCSELYDQFRSFALRDRPSLFEIFNHHGYSYREATQNRIHGSALDLPFADVSKDIVFSNELHDAFCAQGYIRDEHGEGKKIMIDFDEQMHQFFTRYAELSVEDKALYDWVLSLRNQDKYPDQFRYDNYVIANTDSIRFIKEATRVLKPGGITVHADYVTAIEPFDKKTGYANAFAIQLPTGLGYDLIKHLEQYHEPYQDVTVHMDPDLITYASDAYGMEVMYCEKQDDVIYDYCRKDLAEMYKYIRTKFDFNFITMVTRKK